MDEAQTLAPSTGNTSSTASTITLASQARKYGLGLVFATQAPKGLHNQISGNATTQFFGLLNSPAQIEASRELAQAKGSPCCTLLQHLDSCGCGPVDVETLRVDEVLAAEYGSRAAVLL
jgi:DNA helicase HerA-like ATPase